MVEVKAAAITGDVVQSSQLTTTEKRKLQEAIQHFAKEQKEMYPDLQLEQYRGDSIQAILKENRSEALNIALQLFCVLARQDIKIRLGIALGNITYQAPEVVVSDGTALQLSGPLPDELKKRNELFAVTASDEEFAKEWLVHSASLNFIMQRLSAAQAEALYLQLHNYKQEEIAKKLNISQPSVHQRLQAAGAQVIILLVQRFKASANIL